MTREFSRCPPPRSKEREETFKHTFNVRHSQTYNWTVSMNQMLAGRETKFTATDPGIDDITFTWEWGDGSPATISTHPNGGTFPFAATDEEIHVNATAGTYEVKLTTTDDDGGAAEILITVSY